MPIISQQELPGSPFEQTSAGVGYYVWDPTASGTNDLLPGETPTSPTALVYQTDPAYSANVADYEAVTSGVVVSTYPQVIAGNKIALALKSLLVGYEYLCLLTFTATSGSHLPSRFFRVRVKI